MPPQNPQGKLVGERTWLATKLKKENPLLKEIPDEDVERLYADKFPELKPLVGKPMSESQKAEFAQKDINLPLESPKPAKKTPIDPTFGSASFGAETIDPGAKPTFDELPKVPAPKPELPGSFGSGYYLKGTSGLKDMGLSALRAGMSLGDLLVGGLDLASAAGNMGEGTVRKELEAYLGYDPQMTKDYISSFDSPELKKAQEEYAQSKGFTGAVKSLWRNPGLVGLAIEESIPSIYAGGAAARTIAGATGAAPLIAGALGEGSVTAASQASQIYDEKGALSGRDAVIAAGSGLLTGGVTLGSGKAATKLGLPDIDTMLADKTIKGSRKIPALIGGGVMEALEEAPQSAQEQASLNLATGKPLGTGVAGSTVMGAATGFAMGVGHPAARGIKDKFTEVKLPNSDGTTDTYTPTGHPNVDAANAELASKGMPPLTNDEAQKIIKVAEAQAAAATPPVVPPPTAAAPTPAPVDVGQVAVDRMNKIRAKTGLGPLSGKEAKVVARNANEAEVARKIQERISAERGEPTVPTPPAATATPTTPTANVPPPGATKGTTFEPGVYLSHEGKEVIVEGPNSTFGKDVVSGAIVPIKHISPAKISELTPDHVRTLRGTPNVPPPVTRVEVPPGQPIDQVSDVRAGIRSPEEIFAAQPDVDPNLNQGVGNPGLAGSGVAPIPVAETPAPVVTAPPTITGAGPTQPTRTVPAPGSRIASATPARRINIGRGAHEAVTVVFGDDHGKRVMRAFKRDGDAKARTELVNQASYDFKIPTHGEGKSATAGLNAYRRYVIDSTKTLPSRTDDPNGLVFEPKTFSEFMTQNYLPEEGRAAGKPAKVEKVDNSAEIATLRAKNEALLNRFLDPDTPAEAKGKLVGEITDVRNRLAELSKEASGGLNDVPDVDITPKFAKIKGGGLVIDSDNKRATVNITNDYTSPLPGIMVREALQNALDAADRLGTDGEIKVRINRNNRSGGKDSIEVYDNGSGLDETMLAEKLTRLFATGKENEAGATGGKGIGSASYIAGGEKFHITTVAVDSIDGKKYEIFAGGTPEQFSDPVKGSDWDKVEVPMSTPTGTRIETFLKPDQNINHASIMVKKIVNFTRNRKSTIIYDQYGMHTGAIDEMTPSTHGAKETKFAKTKDDKVIGDFVTTHKKSAVKVSIPTFDPTIERRHVEIHYLNNGMYQFSETMNLGEDNLKEIPENVIVDLNPLVDEQDPDYPFINTREDVKGDIREEISNFLDENIKGPAVENRKNRVQELYDKMSQGLKQEPGMVRKGAIFDPGDRMTAAERKTFVNSPVVKELIKHYDEVFNTILQNAGKPEWTDRLEGVGIVLDPGLHGVHIPNPTTKKSTIMLNPFIMIDRTNPKNAAWDGTITQLHEAGHIGRDKASPFQFTPDDLADPRVGEWFATYLNEITVHGDTGWDNTGHAMDFAQRLGEVYAAYGVSATYDAAEALEQIYTGGNTIGGYSTEIQKLLQIYIESRGRDEVTEDLLSGTGVKQEVTPGSKRDSKRPDKTDGKGATAERGKEGGVAKTKIQELRETAKYQIFDHQTGETVGYARTLKGAINSVDKRDSAYGAVRFGHRRNTEFVGEWKTTQETRHDRMIDQFRAKREEIARKEEGPRGSTGTVSTESNIPRSNFGGAEMKERADALTRKIDQAYRDGDTKKAVSLSQELGEIENALRGQGPVRTGLYERAGFVKQPVRETQGQPSRFRGQQESAHNPLLPPKSPDVYAGSHDVLAQVGTVYNPEGLNNDLMPVTTPEQQAALKVYEDELAKAWKDSQVIPYTNSKGVRTNDFYLMDEGKYLDDYHNYLVRNSTDFKNAIKGIDNLYNSIIEKLKLFKGQHFHDDPFVQGVVNAVLDLGQHTTRMGFRFTAQHEGKMGVSFPDPTTLKSGTRTSTFTEPDERFGSFVDLPGILYFAKGDPKKFAYILRSTLVHELAHNISRAEGGPHDIVMQVIDTLTKDEIDAQFKMIMDGFFRVNKDGTHGQLRGDIQKAVRFANERTGPSSGSRSPLMRANRNLTNLLRRPKSQANVGSTGQGGGGLKQLAAKVKDDDGGKKKKRKKPKKLSKKRRTEARKSAIEKVHHVLANIEPIRLNMEEKRTLARSRRLKDFHAVRTKGIGGMYERMSKLSGPYPKADFESIAHKFTDDEMTTLVDMIHESNLGGFSKPAAYSGLMKMFNSEFGEIPTATETIFLGDVFGKKLKDVINKKRGDEGFINVREFHEGIKDFIDSEAFGKVKKWTDTKRMEKWYKTTKHPYLDVLDGFKAFILGMDSAAPGRQGLALIHKEAFWKALGPQYKAMWSEDYHQKNMTAIEKKVMFRQALDAGLELTTANAEDATVSTDKGDVQLNKTENDIAYGFAEAIPGLGRAVRGSNRGAVTFLDNLRIDTFTQLAMARYNHSQEASVETMKELEDIARFVNIMTGRGQSGKFLKMLSPVLNRMYFSVPWVVSRIQLLDPRNYYSKETSGKLLDYQRVYASDSPLKAVGKVAANIPRMVVPFKKQLKGKPPKFMVNEYRKAMGALLAQGGILMGAVYGMYLIGSPMVPEFEIGVDPRKSDFGKLKIGHNIELDVFGSVMQYIVLGTRLVRGEMVNREGEVVPFDKHAGGQGPTRWSTLDNWQANKTLPYIEITRMYLEHLDRQTGKPPAEGAYQDKALRGVTPISVQDITEVARANPWALPFIAYALLGGGINVQEPKPKGSQFKLPGGTGKEIDKFDIPGGKKY